MKVRVLHIIDSFDLGGGQTALLNLIEATDRERFEPAVATMHGRGVFWPRFEALGLPVYSLSPRKWLPVYVPRLAGVIREFRPAIVHCHLFGANWIAKPVAAAMGVRVRVNHDQCNDGLRYERPVARWLDTWTNRLSSHVCAVSGSTRDFLIEHEGLAPGEVSVVYNGIDPDRFSTERPPAGRERFVVLGVGRLHPQKNFVRFLEAAAELIRRGLSVEFRLAGTGPEEERLRALAAERGILDKVRFLGHVDDTPRLYAEADALLMTSDYEGTPLTILEAMAARLPIVAPSLDGIGEVLRDGEDALLISSPEPVHFADAVERLLRGPELAARLAATAHEKVRASYSSRAMAAQVEAIYERCLVQRN